MKENLVCLITGPAGTGKSSAARALAEKFDRSAVIDVDQFREMVIGGYVRPWPHSDEVEIQLSLSAKNASDIAHNFLEQGFSVFIDDVVGRKLLEQYSGYFKDKDFKTFLLLPSLESLLKRFDDRGEDKELRARTHDLYERFSRKKDELHWVVIDSSNQTLEETVEEMYNLIKDTP
jgi:guanylate kinase